MAKQTAHDPIIDGQVGDVTEGTVSEVMPIRNLISDDTYLDIKSEADALAVIASTFGELEEASEALGTGFVVIPTDEKVRYQGVKLIFIEWKFYQGDTGEFVSAHCLAVTRTGVEKVIINDGGTGIYAQLKAYTKRTGREGGLVAAKGLRVNEYDYTNDKGQTTKARTAYIAA